MEINICEFSYEDSDYTFISKQLEIYYYYFHIGMSKAIFTIFATFWLLLSSWFG